MKSLRSPQQWDSKSGPTGLREAILLRNYDDVDQIVCLVAQEQGILDVWMAFDSDLIVIWWDMNGIWMEVFYEIWKGFPLY